MGNGKIRVKAGANGPVFLPVPIQGVRTIGDDPFEVESTRFIRGRLAAGDLVLVTTAHPFARSLPTKKED